MSAGSFREIVRALRGQRYRRGIVPASGDETKSKSSALTNNIFKTSAHGKKQANDHLTLDMNEVKTMLPNSETENEINDGKNHKINGEVCLLKESPFRILRNQDPPEVKHGFALW